MQYSPLTRSMLAAGLVAFTQVALSGCGGAEARTSEWPEATDETASPWADDAPRASSWLDRLRAGDVLTYVHDGDRGILELRVERIVRRGEGVAAELLPTSFATPLDVRALWLAGDSRGLHALFDRRRQRGIPLDERGRVVPFETMSDGLESWEDGELASASFSVDELDLAVDGARPDDECAWISREQRVVTRLLVCASLGVVQIRTGPEQGESDWRLEDVRRADR